MLRHWGPHHMLRQTLLNAYTDEMVYHVISKYIDATISGHGWGHYTVGGDRAQVGAN